VLLVILLVSILIITPSTSLLNLLAVVFSYISNPTSKNSFNAFSLLFSKVSYKYFILFLFASFISSLRAGFEYPLPLYLSSIKIPQSYISSSLSYW